jgi:hypothetical protein
MRIEEALTMEDGTGLFRRPTELNDDIVGPSGIPVEHLHPALEPFAARLASAPVLPKAPDGAKLMPGIGGITACVVMRRHHGRHSKRIRSTDRCLT